MKSSAGFENIKTIILDEYPIEKSRFRSYLPDEGMLLLGLFDSILRNRSDVRIFILGNATEGIEYCPLFTFFDLMPFHRKAHLLLLLGAFSSFGLTLLICIAYLLSFCTSFHGATVGARLRPR